MSGLGRKLDLYGERPPVPDAHASISANPAGNAEGSDAVWKNFGGVALEGIAPGVFRRTIELPEAEYGRLHLSTYRPFSLSAVLELTILPERIPVHPEEILFLDTETTGLSRGVGNIPFLTGLGYFRGGRLILEQLYLDDPGGEEAYLDRLIALWDAHPYLVSFNGKSFDVPIIRNRLILNRRRHAGPRYHFDLLHICRRLFPRGTVAAYNQKAMEQELLGAVRKDDIGGDAIPQIYFDYRKYGHDGGMEKVIEHNRLDVLGMVFLFLEAVRVYDAKETSHAALRSGIARILSGNRRREEAITLLETDTPASLRHKDLLLLANLYRLQARWNDAYQTYRVSVERFSCRYSHQALVRVLEHRLVRLDEASREVENLLQRTDLFPEEREKLLRARDRLIRKTKQAEK